MRFLSVCSGMEAASVAWEPLGWKAVGFSEIEPFPCAILKHRFPNTPNYGSLTEYQQWPLGPDSIDLLVGGTPCQSFSVAGLRKGLADPRGNLALTFLGLADKLRPRWIVWENVPGVLSSGGGRDFGSFLGALEQLGYGWAYRVLDAQHFGVPQRRRRVFVVASLGGRDVAASVLLKPESLCWHPAKGRKKGQATAPDAGSGVEAGNGCWWDGGQVSQTLDAVLQKGQTMPEKNRFPAVLQPLTYDMKQHHNPQPSDNVQLTTKNCAFIRGDTPLIQPIPFRKSKRACSTTDNETWVEADASNTLNNFDLGDTRTTHAVVEPIPIQDGRDMDKKQNGMGVANEGDPAYTIDTTGAQAIAIQGTIIGRGENAGPQGVGATEGGPMFTLTKTDIYGVCHQKVYENHAQDSRITGPLEIAPTVAAKFGTGGGNVPLVNQEQIYENSRRDAIRIYEGTSPTLQSFMGTGGCNVPMVNTASVTQADVAGPLDAHYYKGPGSRQGGEREYVAHPPAMAVRRLTPTECERLQGFPDNWSRIPWKGKPEDQCPDGPRYKACGNSMAVPVMRWIGEQIARVELSHNQPTNTNA